MSFFKNRVQEGKTDLVWGVDTSGMERIYEKGVGG
jgi:hypothetical protein